MALDISAAQGAMTGARYIESAIVRIFGKGLGLLDACPPGHSAEAWLLLIPGF